MNEPPSRSFWSLCLLRLCTRSSHILPLSLCEKKGTLKLVDWLTPLPPSLTHPVGSNPHGDGKERKTDQSEPQRLQEKVRVGDKDKRKNLKSPGVCWVDGGQNNPSLPSRDNHSNDLSLCSSIHGLVCLQGDRCVVWVVVCLREWPLPLSEIKD